MYFHVPYLLHNDLNSNQFLYIILDTKELLFSNSQ